MPLAHLPVQRPTRAGGASHLHQSVPGDDADSSSSLVDSPVIRIAWHARMCE
jgi:hypothetical protein